MGNQFRTRLKELRKEKKIIQTKLGKHLGYGYTAIANYESGRNEPSLDTLVQIANIFDVSIDYLLGNDETALFMDSISPEEKEMLRFYRRLQEKEKEALLLLLKGLNRRVK